MPAAVVGYGMCGLSQTCSATGENIQSRCQWPNIVVPLAMASMELEEGAAVVWRCGYQEETSVKCIENGWVGGMASDCEGNTSAYYDTGRMSEHESVSDEKTNLQLSLLPSSLSRSF
jgi:hypothetical protein